MARKRYLKPGFFKNEDLAELDFADRILFQGLWCWADREGRLGDRPKLLKAEIFPYDDINVDAALNRLSEKNFITRYDTKVNGADFKAIEIINFKKHQDVHVKEQASNIPAPVLHGATNAQAPVETGTSTSLNLELGTLNLELGKDVVDDTCEQEYTFEDANNDFKNGQKQEKKVASKKEVPELGEMIERIEASGTCHWWNVIEFYLGKGVKWDKLNSQEQQVYFDQRAELFKKFYAGKRDNYLIRLPSCNEIAQNFYNWIPSELNREKLQQLNNSAINRSKTSKNVGDRRGSTDAITAFTNTSLINP